MPGTLEKQLMEFLLVVPRMHSWINVNKTWCIRGRREERGVEGPDKRGGSKGELEGAVRGVTRDS